MAREYTNYDPGSEYWATLDIEDLLPVLMDKIDDYYDKRKTDGIEALDREMYAMYYGLEQGAKRHESHKIVFIGNNDEGIRVRSGHARNILQHIYISATGQDPNYICRAINNDQKSISQTYTAKSVLEYFMYEREFNDALTGAAELCLIFNRGYVWLGWDIITNDAFAEAQSPLTVISDLSNQKKKQSWHIVVDRVNKWEVAAKYDVSEEDLDELFECADIKQHFTGFDNIFDYDESDDYINLYHFYHAKTPALPNGRMVIFTNDKYALYPAKGEKDDRLPYQELPIYPIEHGRMFHSPYAHTVMYDIAAHERLHNVALSTIHSQLNRFGKKVIVGPKKPSYENYGDYEYFGYGEGERPAGLLDLTPISDTLFKVKDTEKQEMETLSAMNAAIRGSSEGQKSGSHAALLHSVAVQFQTGFHRRYTKLLERCGTGLLRLLKEFYEEEKIIEIVGMDGEPYLRAWTRDDISLIDRVVVENGPSVLRSMAGKLHFADSMLEKGLISNPKDYQEVLDTGQLQGLLTPARHENAGIRAENELLMQPEKLHLIPMTNPATGQPVMDNTGQPLMVVKEVRALLVDDDPLHINEHKFLLMHPTFRENTELVQAVLTHIKEHIWLAQNTPPDLLTALGKKPFPQQGAMGPPGPGNPPNPSQNQPGARPPGPPAMMNEQNLQQQAGSVPDPNYPVSGLPNMPSNPIG